MEQTVEQMMLKELNDWNRTYANKKEELLEKMWETLGAVAFGSVVLAFAGVLGIAVSFDNIPDALFCIALLVTASVTADLVFLIAYRIYIHSKLSCLKMRRPIIDWEDVKLKKLVNKY